MFCRAVDMNNLSQIGLAAIGTGAIVKTMSAHLQARADVNMVAIASATGRAFDETYGFKLKCTVYELLQNDEVDVVYVASANSKHVNFVRSALEAGKHVLCEKPMMYRETQLGQSLMALAALKGRVLMEGVFTAYLPGMAVLRSFAFGKPLRIELNKKIKWTTVEASPLLKNYELGGGVFLGCGSYTAQALLAIVGAEAFRRSSLSWIDTSIDVEPLDNVDKKTVVYIDQGDWKAKLVHEFRNAQKDSIIEYENATVAFELTKMDKFNITTNQGLEYTITVPDPLKTANSHIGLNTEIDVMHKAISDWFRGPGVPQYTAAEMQLVAHFMDTISSKVNSYSRRRLSLDPSKHFDADSTHKD